jgi:hypothetical protein
MAKTQGQKNVFISKVPSWDGAEFKSAVGKKIACVKITDIGQAEIRKKDFYEILSSPDKTVFTELFPKDNSSCFLKAGGFREE